MQRLGPSKAGTARWSREYTAAVRHRYRPAHALNLHHQQREEKSGRADGTSAATDRQAGQKDAPTTARKVLAAGYRLHRRIRAGLSSNNPARCVIGFGFLPCEGDRQQLRNTPVQGAEPA